MKKLQRALAVALVACAALAGCDNGALPPAAGVTTINGMILDGVSSKPVAGALVTVDTVLTATTDATGKFSIDKVPSGIVDYTVQATGYKAVAASTNVEPGKPFELDLSLAVDATAP